MARGGGPEPAAHPFMSNLANQLLWYIAVRVVAIGSVLIPYALLQIGPTSPPPQVEGSAPSEITLPAPVGGGQPGQPPMVGPPAPPPEMELLRPEVVFRLGGLTFAATLLYIALLRILRHRPTVQAYIQFFGDLLLI